MNNTDQNVPTNRLYLVNYIYIYIYIHIHIYNLLL